MSNDKPEYPSRRKLLVGGTLGVGGLAALSIANAAAVRKTSPAQVETLLDERSITDLLVRYASAVDERDWKRFDEVFAANATAFYGFSGDIGGRAAIVDFLRNTADLYGASQHLLGNFRIAVNGDQATAKCYVQAILVGLGNYRDQHLSFWGEYRDRLSRGPEGWRIVRRELASIRMAGDIGLGGAKKTD